VPVDEVIAELQMTLAEIPAPDYITFSGAGEPTLNSRIGDVVDFVKSNYPQIKLCLLTNGVLLGDETLRRAIAAADLVIPSLDASNEAEYRTINRPAAGSTLAELVEDIAGFAREYTHRLVLEIFIVPGVNDSPASIARFAELVRYIAPDAVQLNTLDRPGVVPDLQAAPPETLAAFQAVLQDICEIEAVKPLQKSRQQNISTELEGKLLDIIRHRRVDIAGLAGISGIPETELRPILLRLEQRNLLVIAADGFLSAVK
jgi:wyosine [tRNA(Phe)-imidazoG37] synthetase (radical SAM superfamily)